MAGVSTIGVDVRQSEKDLGRRTSYCGPIRPNPYHPKPKPTTRTALSLTLTLTPAALTISLTLAALTLAALTTSLTLAALTQSLTLQAQPSVGARTVGPIRKPSLQSCPVHP